MILEVFSKLSDCIDLRCCVKLWILLQRSFGEYEAVGPAVPLEGFPSLDSPGCWDTNWWDGQQGGCTFIFLTCF